MGTWIQIHGILTRAAFLLRVGVLHYTIHLQYGKIDVGCRRTLWHDTFPSICHRQLDTWHCPKEDMYIYFIYTTFFFWVTSVFTCISWSPVVGRILRRFLLARSDKSQNNWRFTLTHFYINCQATHADTHTYTPTHSHQRHTFIHRLDSLPITVTRTATHKLVWWNISIYFYSMFCINHHNQGWCANIKAIPLIMRVAHIYTRRYSPRAYGTCRTFGDMVSSSNSGHQTSYTPVIDSNKRYRALDSKLLTSLNRRTSPATVSCVCVW